MTKQFFDVFPTLKVNSDCKVLFEIVWFPSFIFFSKMWK